MRRNLKRKKKTRIRRPPRRSRAGNQISWRLALAVLVSIGVMIGLGHTLFSFLYEENLQGEDTAGLNTRTRPASDKILAAKSPNQAPEPDEKPKIMFYEELEDQDETRGRNSSAGTSAFQPKADDSLAASSPPKIRALKRAKPPSPRRVRPARKEAPVRNSVGQKGRSLSNRGATGSRRIYTVQVGAFSNPGLAQQWAEQWEEKGFKVTIKPVARPGAGVLYRLFLGEFTNKRDADSLVARLKVNEGISALRLLVRQ
jgi:cell division septation protein DedD